MSKQDLLKELFEKYLNDKTMTPTEIRQLRALVQDGQHQELLDQLLASLYEEDAPGHVAAESNTRAAFEEVWAKLQTPAPVTSPGPAVVYLQPRRKWWKYVAAAIVVLTFAAGAYWLFRDNTTASIVKESTPSKTTIIQPGSKKAILILADGSTIALDEAQNGTLGQQGNTRVVKQANGELAYEVGGNAPVTATLYNTISTPRGGKFNITLPDGSRVWLNAASSLHYPTAFNGAAREVTLTGEAYFEVAKNAAMPFRVLVDKMQVEVLGTHFNVMAYKEEGVINTTLLEGKVKVIPAANPELLTAQVPMVLAPGQRASLIRSDGKLEISDGVNTEDAIAWKNDLIQFGGNNIHTAMRMIARWYDVEVEYRGSIPNAHFRGGISSNVPVSQVLDMMEQTGEVHFEISGRKIIVTP
jgi:ferric-dicitrate binding protein FerR (iron transport regulator)